MKTGTVHVKEEREKVSQVNSSSNAEPGYSEKLQNEDLIYSISPLTNTRLTEFRSEMITLINKNGDQPMFLGDRDSYSETNNLPKTEKGKTGDTHSDDLSALFKNSAENNNNGAVGSQKRLITNNDGGTNTPAKVPCCQNPAKTMSDVKRADKRSQNYQASVVKSTAGMIKLCDNLLKAEKQNYVVNTEDLLSLTTESIMLLGHVNFSMNNMRRDRIKNSWQKDLHS